MPQMKPLMWICIMLISILLMFFTMSLLYFFPMSPLKKNSNYLHYKLNLMPWTW